MSQQAISSVQQSDPMQIDSAAVAQVDRDLTPDQVYAVIRESKPELLDSPNLWFEAKDLQYLTDMTVEGCTMDGTDSLTCKVDHFLQQANHKDKEYVLSNANLRQSSLVNARIGSYRSLKQLQRALYAAEQEPERIAQAIKATSNANPEVSYYQDYTTKMRDYWTQLIKSSIVHFFVNESNKEQPKIRVVSQVEVDRDKLENLDPVNKQLVKEALEQIVDTANSMIDSPWLGRIAEAVAQRIVWVLCRRVYVYTSRRETYTVQDLDALVMRVVERELGEHLYEDLKINIDQFIDAHCNEYDEKMKLLKEKAEKVNKVINFSSLLVFLSAGAYTWGVSGTLGVVTSMLPGGLLFGVAALLGSQGPTSLSFIKNWMGVNNEAEEQHKRLKTMITSGVKAGTREACMIATISPLFQRTCRQWITVVRKIPPRDSCLTDIELEQLGVSI